MSSPILNMFDVESLVESFMKERGQGINTLHRIYFKNNDPVSVQAFKESLMDELRTGVVAFINKNEPLENLNSYLFYIVNAFGKKQVSTFSKRKTEYLCPGCLFLGKESIVYYHKVFKCDDCKEESNRSNDPKRILFFKTFAAHNKNGYRCGECKRFIPHPLDNNTEISCPYFDCCFAGSHASLKKMHHPTSQSNPEKLILDASKQGMVSLKDNTPSQEPDVLSKLELEQEMKQKLKMLLNIIEYQSNSVPYSSSGFTIKHKQCAYAAFAKLLEQYPDQMIDYLLNNSRKGGFQSKAFQHYVDLIEESLPLVITKNNKNYTIDNLLDPNLGIFDGISTFTNLVSESLVIKNNTQEFYIGGRKATYSQPFYIGKLLRVVDVKTKQNLMDKVVNYTFSKIKMKDISPGTDVSVTHLRIPPHYEMGGMVYINRVKDKIVERARFIMNKDLNED